MALRAKRCRVLLRRRKRLLWRLAQEWSRSPRKVRRRAAPKVETQQYLDDTQVAITGLLRARQRALEVGLGGGFLETLARTAVHIAGPALALDGFLLGLLVLGSVAGILTHR